MTDRKDARDAPEPVAKAPALDPNEQPSLPPADARAASPEGAKPSAQAAPTTASKEASPPAQPKSPAAVAPSKPPDAGATPKPHEKKAPAERSPSTRTHADPRAATAGSTMQPSTWLSGMLELAVALVAALCTLVLREPFGALHLALLGTAGAFVLLAVLGSPSLSLVEAASDGSSPPIIETLRGSAVQGVLFLTWLGFLLVLYFFLDPNALAFVANPSPTAGTFRVPSSAEVWLVVAVCATPKVVAFAAAMIITRRIDESKFSLSLGDGSPMPNLAKAHARMLSLWNYEGTRCRQSMRRATQHAGFMGLLASVSLCLCTIAAGLPQSVGKLTTPVARSAVAVATASTTVFVLGLAYILMRAASDDASTRMFARVGRDLVIAVVAAVLAMALMKDTVTSISASIVVGMGCALLGSPLLRALADRAGSFLGMAARKAPAPDGLAGIEGIGDDDVARLGEEGIDSIHALAFCPTARVFFNTKYSLQRICDWQDQALLIAYLGAARAAKLREAFAIRGALDAQVLAFALSGIIPADLEIDRRALAEGYVEVVTRDRDLVARSLGVSDGNQAIHALRTLVNDELVDRLRMYWRAATELSGDAMSLE